MATTTQDPASYGFGGLPVELVAMIKSYIPPTDLRTHVCFYYTCRMSASMYGTSEEEEAFWKRCCALCGIGMTPQDVEMQYTWKQVAVECVEMDGFCSHPGCGSVLLDWNGAH